MRALPAAILAAALSLAAWPQGPANALTQAEAALEAGEADKALALLEPVVAQADAPAQAHNVDCRVRLIVGDLDRAVNECEKAVALDPDNAWEHLWLGRALGEKADRATFLSAYSLAKRVRSEFNEAVRLDPHNAEALASLGEFDCSAPGIVGGGLEKAEDVAAQLEKVDQPKAHELLANIAEQRKDYDAAEHEFRRAIETGEHPAYQWMALASFYRRRQHWPEMVGAVRSGFNAEQRDRRAAPALFNGASTLARAKRELPLAAKLMEDYLASQYKSEDAPAFVAYWRLAQVKDDMGDGTAAERDRTAALGLAHDYSPAQSARH
jgi:tetratricopeptide (TPR) repeat protein